jgi:P27 family predicted phage terminase small subunit
MRERETKPKGLKDITSSLHKLPPETKKTELVRRILECPPELGTVARQEWDRIVGELTSLGVLSSFDRGPLAAYCNAYALWIEAMEGVQKYGAMIKSPNGYPTQSPYLATVNRQAEIMMLLPSSASPRRVAVASFRIHKTNRCCWKSRMNLMMGPLNGNFVESNYRDIIDNKNAINIGG